ncbi:hypothetical protein B9J93_07775 [Vibrio sp. V17_P4S1T151]|nr:hypothetical protein B9J93_07775 [Vibrio sp. V17_P4S1T151]OXX64517.1 hypothetical protein B9J89_01020 [Vibrio sp. V15_P4S5T153]
MKKDITESRVKELGQIILLTGLILITKAIHRIATCTTERRANQLPQFFQMACLVANETMCIYQLTMNLQALTCWVSE